MYILETFEKFRNYIYFYQNLIIVFGLLISFFGGSWDITFHLLSKPESFFSIPHFLVYSGIFIIIFTFYFNIKKNWNFKKDKDHLLIFIGTIIILLAGPFDFGWHSIFGLDGLLSPPHLTLSVGWLFVGLGIIKNTLNSVKSTINFNKLKDAGKVCGVKEEEQNDRNGIENDRIDKNSKLSKLKKLELILEFSFILMILSGLIYFFSLPFSETNYYNFNPHPIIALILSVIGFPLLFSWYFNKIISIFSNQFGIITCVGITYISTILLSQIIPNPFIINFTGFYLLNIIPFLIVDILFVKKNYMQIRGKKIRSLKSRIVSGLIIGICAYSICFPLNTYIYNEVLYDYQITQDRVLGIYIENLSDNYFFVIVFSITGVIIGSVLDKELYNNKKTT
ncbi:MAG: hypothetical protein H0X03_06770 [Nitrosopumilus sp.]|nr:hypothetical protein [Nitrosopumilus sp.]